MLKYPINVSSLVSILAYFAQLRVPLQHGWRLPPTHCRALAERLGEPAPKIRLVREHRPLALHLSLLLTANLLTIEDGAFTLTDQAYQWLQQPHERQVAQLNSALGSADPWHTTRQTLHLPQDDSERIYLRQQLDRYQHEELHSFKSATVLMEPHHWSLQLPHHLPPHLHFHLLLLCDWITDRLLHLTPFTLANALTNHVSHATAEAIIGRLQGSPLTDEQRTTLREWANRAQQYRVQHTLLLQTQRKEQLDLLVARRGLRQYILQRFSGTLAAVTPSLFAPLTRWLHGQQIPFHPPSDATNKPSIVANESYKALRLVSELMRQYKLPHLNPHHALSLLNETLDVTTQNLLDQQVDVTLKTLKRKIDGYDLSPAVDTPDEALVQQVERAVMEEQPIQIYYQGQHDEHPRWRTIEPRWIEPDDPASYLRAFCYSANAMRVFRLDRLLDVKPAD